MVPVARACRSRLPWLIGLFLAATSAPSGELERIEVGKGHSELIETTENVSTIAVGDPEIAGAVVITPKQVLVNGLKTGATSLTILGENDYARHYQLQVTHDLAVLQDYLRGLDPRIRVQSDPNGDAVMLLGTVPTRELAARALEATVRFLGTSSITLGTIAPTTVEQRVAAQAHDALRAGAGGAAGEATAPAGTTSGSIAIYTSGNEQTTASQGYTQTHTTLGVGEAKPIFTETVQSGDTRVVNLLVVEEDAVPAVERLQTLLRQVNQNVTAEQINNIFVLNGMVRNPAELTRILVLADRFVGGTGAFDFTVVSDRGGVLAGDLTEEDAVELVVDDVGGSGGTGRGRGRGTGGGGTAHDLATRGFIAKPSDPKGNLGQNISRGDVVSIADGRVVSLIRIEEQPRVEIKMRIVAIDRDMTDRFGIDWRIDGPTVTIGSLINDIVPVLPAPDAAAINAGESDLVANIRPGLYSIQMFIQALEDRGAARTLSEPLLTAVSGEAANFLVGGEVPIVSGTSSTQNNLQTVSTQDLVFREFGINLIVRPTVLENGRIAITLDQVLSEPDFAANTVTIGGNIIPSFRKRSVRTLTESSDGETWAVAGLLSAEESRALQKVPWIADVPILGLLFRHQQTREIRSELMLTVSARRILDGQYERLEELPARPPVPGLDPGPAAGAAPAGNAAVAVPEAAAPRRSWLDFFRSGQRPAPPAGPGYRPFGAR